MNYNATTIKEAKSYMSIRYKELAALGISVIEESNWYDKALISRYDNNCISVYILKDWRGKGLYKKILKTFDPHIITFPDCKIENYLKNQKAKYTVLTPSVAYNMIREYYGDTTTKRSGVKLINHVDEGIEILNKIGASQVVIDAYCLHPLLQSDEDFNSNLQLDYSGIKTESLLLAVEYRRVANSYLSTGNIDNFVGFTNESIKQMLYADKVQNEKDFSLYHEGTHKRSSELREYFDNWLNKLLKVY